jgi:hypothetical protein
MFRFNIFGKFAYLYFGLVGARPQYAEAAGVCRLLSLLQGPRIPTSEAGWV